MKVGYPICTVIVYKKLLEMLGHEVVETPRPTRQTIALGVKNSPEFACFPYKAIMGSYIELAQIGVEMIITSGGRGPCRAGLYEQIHRKTLASLGYDIDVVNFDLYKKNWSYAMKNFAEARGKAGIFRAVKAVKLVYYMIHALDRMEAIVETRRAYEKVPGSYTKLWNRINRTFDREVHRLRDVRKFEKVFTAELLALPIDEPPEETKIRIGIVGEIYVVMESAITLTSRKSERAWVRGRRDLYLSDWVNDNLLPFLHRGHERQILAKSRKYMEIKIGGHENETVGHIIDYKEKDSTASCTSCPSPACRNM
jgi:predicted nucleotide-binding protein (sugar kinase/HSP70/actin superfamily)